VASNYPGSLDSFDTIASDKKTSDSVGGRTHRDMHNDLGDAIEAVQAELGTTPSGSYATVKARFEAIEGSTLPQVDAKGDLIVGTADNTYDNLGVGTNDTVLLAASGETKGVKWAQVPTAAIQDGAVTAAKLGSDVRIGNLLTANQASGTDTLSNTTGFTAQTNCTLASSTAQALQGSRSLAVTATAAAWTMTLSSQVPVDPGERYTASVASRAATAAAQCRVDIAFYTPGGSWLATVSGAQVSNTTAGWTTVTATGVAPAGAGLAQVAYNFEAASVGHVHYTDCWGLWRGTGGQWALPGQPILGLTDAPIGNLLSLNQATGASTSGIGVGGTTLARVSDALGYDGYAVEVTKASAGNGYVVIGGASDYIAAPYTIPCRPGEVVTATVDVWSPSDTQTATLKVRFKDASGGNIVTHDMPTTLSTSVKTLRNTLIAPASTAYVMAYVEKVQAGSGSESFRYSRASIHKGAAGVYAPPGLPIVGQSHIATNGAVHLSGTGSPEGVVTAAPGSTWLQTDSTTDVKGWIRWVKATGTGNTGWVAGPEADTGVRRLTAESGYTVVNSTCHLVRRGGTVALTAILQKDAGNYAANDLPLILPAGFRPVALAYRYQGSDNAGNPVGAQVNTSGEVRTNDNETSAYLYLHIVFATRDAWPSSLPGSPA
jgi:hypothetical protein